MSNSGDHSEDRSRSVKQSVPSWQLPVGVTRGAWDYLNDSSIATEYDRFHAGHPLLELDRKLVDEHLGESSQRSDGAPRVAVDFGCGTGRNLIPLAEKGWRVVGVDLSSEMLKEFVAKASKLQDATQSKHEPIAIRANMAKLECFADGFADAVLCMYSSLGMVQGRANRRSFMKHSARMLREGGVFFVHVHNRGSWLRDPGGIQRTVMDWLRARRDSSWELGDRIYAYRGLPSMFLHIYSERELLSDLKSSGLTVTRLYRLNRQSSQVLKSRWFPHLQSGGFIAVCSKQGNT